MWLGDSASLFPEEMLVAELPEAQNHQLCTAAVSMVALAHASIPSYDQNLPWLFEHLSPNPTNSPRISTRAEEDGASNKGVP